MKEGGKKHALETLLFSRRRNNETRVPDGDVAQLVLTAITKPFAPKTARTHGNLGLQELIAGALGIFFRVQERSDSFPLIGLEDSPANGRIENSAHKQNPRQ